MDSKKTGARENRVCVTTDSGNTIWIPESRLEAWEKADHDAPPTEKEQELLHKITSRIYGGESTSPKSSPSDLSDELRQTKRRLDASHMSMQELIQENYELKQKMKKLKSLLRFLLIVMFVLLSYLLCYIFASLVAK